MHPDLIESIREHLDADTRLVHTEKLVGGVSADVHWLDLMLLNGETMRVVVRIHRQDHSGIKAETEFQLHQALHKQALPVPEALLVDVSGKLCSTPYFVMKYIEGSSVITKTNANSYTETMANELVNIHAIALTSLPTLPLRIDPLPEIFEFLPKQKEWDSLRDHLKKLKPDAYTNTPKLLHGDFWPENLLWQNNRIVGILDWEDAAIGDPLSDVAGCQLELRYKFGKQQAQKLVDEYSIHRNIDRNRLALWQLYVAAAAHRFMGEWSLDENLEAHMRQEALSTIQEASDTIMTTKQ